MSLTSKDKRDIYLHSPPAASLAPKFLDGKAAMLFLTPFRGQKSTLSSYSPKYPTSVHHNIEDKSHTTRQLEGRPTGITSRE